MPYAHVQEPEMVARYETAGWEAYYDRNWPRAFWLLVRLNRRAFRMSWFGALAAALDTVRASIAFAPLQDNDLPRARRHLARFYARARRAAGIAAEAQTLAELELDYWIVHRELALRRQADPQDYDIEPLITSLANLHAALFDATPEAMRLSAEWRARAARAVDGITGGYSPDVAEDWRRVEDYLQKAYRAVRAGSLNH